VTTPTITPEIRSQALGHALTASQAIVEGLTLPQLAELFVASPKSLYELADSYAAYIATGAHPT
jgi:hypothetical protein